MTIRDHFKALFRATMLNTSAFAEPVVYQQGETSKTIAAVIERTPVEDRPSVTGQTTQRDATIQISSDASDGIVQPVIGDSVTFDSLDWAVQTISNDDSGLWVLTLHSDTNTRFQDKDFYIGRQ